MLEHLLLETCEKFPFEYKERDKENAYTLDVAGIRIKVKALDPGVHLYTPIGPVPKLEELDDPEAFLLYIIEANYLGQGTGGSVLSIGEKGKHFYLEKEVHHALTFPLFSDLLEEFVNYVEYWQKMIAEKSRTT